LEAILTNRFYGPREWALVALASIALSSGVAAAASFGLARGIFAATLILIWAVILVRNIMAGLILLLLVRSWLDFSTDFRLPLPAMLAYLNPAGIIAGIFSIVAAIYLLRHFRGIRVPRAGRWFAVFLVLTALIIPFATLPLTSVQEWVKVLAPFCAYLVMFLYFRSLSASGVRQAASRGVAIIMLASAAPLAIGMYQLITNTGQHLNEGFNRVYGTFPMPNGLAGYISLIIPILICAMQLWTDLLKRTLLVIVIVFALVVLVATYTRAAWFSLVASLVVLIVTARRIRIGPLLFIAVLAIAGYLVAWESISARFSDLSGQGYQDSSLLGRLNIWDAAIPLLFKNPVTGQGLGMFAINMGMFEAQDVPGQASATVIAAHNDYLRVLVETGAIGFVLYFGTFAIFIRNTWKTWKASDVPEVKAVARAFIAVCVGQLVASTAENMFGQPALQFYFWSLAGVAAGLALDPNAVNTGMVPGLQPDQVRWPAPNDPAEDMA
jgi:O-antigen ligase